MVRGVVAAVALACLMAAPTVSADWLQAGHDAARSSHADGPGPQVADVAFSVGLGNDFVDANLVVVDGDIYTAFDSNPDTNNIAAKIIRVSPRENTIETLHMTYSDSALASDGSSLFATSGLSVLALPLAGGAAKSFSTAILGAVPATAADAGLFLVGSCPRLALANRLLYAGCTESGGNVAQPVFYAVAMNATTGTIPWRWLKDTSTEDPQTRIRDPMNPALDAYAMVITGVLNTAPETLFSKFDGLSVLGDRVFALVTETTPGASTGNTATIGPYPASSQLWAIDSATGRGSWRLETPGPAYTLGNAALGLFHPRLPGVVGNDTVAYLQDEYSLLRRNVADGYPTGNRPSLEIDYNDPAIGSLRSNMAFDGKKLYLGTAHTLGQVDVERLAYDWSFALPSSQTWLRTAPVVAERTIYAASTDGVDSVLYALDASRRGEPIWTLPLVGQVTDMAVDGGLLYVRDDSSRLSVIGAAPYGIHVEATTDTLYPAFDGGVAVDLAQSVGGNQGAITDYRVDWGDGSSTDWQAEPTFAHRFTSASDTKATFFARNANQTGQSTMTFYVGRSDPSINIFNSPFGAQYQNTTFFVIGLLATALAAIAGILLRGRKRRRMHREMEQLEATFRSHRDDPETCEPKLVEAKQHYRSLLERRRLEEGQYGILADRAEELLGRLRMGTVEEDFSFLPLGVARTLQRMLRDGRVTAAERSFVLSAVRADEVLSTAQKAKVQEKVERWFHSDAGG